MTLFKDLRCQTGKLLFFGGARCSTTGAGAGNGTTGVGEMYSATDTDAAHGTAGTGAMNASTGRVGGVHDQRAAS